MGDEADKGYETPEAAVRAAMRAAVPLSKQYEYAGAIYERGGRYHFSKPSTSRESHSVKVRVSYPKGARLAALYHTHPSGDDADVFSQHDIEVSDQLGIPYYMGTEDGTTRVFRPGKSEVVFGRRNMLRGGLTRRWSEGELLGNAFEEPKPAAPAAGEEELPGEAELEVTAAKLEDEY